jgi:hypothetical protein
MGILWPYKVFDSPLRDLPAKIFIEDHLNGFDQDLNNSILTALDTYSQNNNRRTVVICHQIFENQVKEKYPNLDLKFDFFKVSQKIWKPFESYKQHPDLAYKNFICSFNGSDHVGRKLLTAILEQFGYFNPNYCSKNFVFTPDTIDGHLKDYVHDQDCFYRKFFIAKNSNEFFNTIYSFGHTKYNHLQNICNLESKIIQSFLHIASETVSTSYVPFVTEKFLYSVVTRGLFLSYAQPGWHAHVEKYYGFKKYNKLFDYRFDGIQNPVERLVELVTMISKFSRLSAHDWHDLYLLETDTIEFNYDWYFSRGYVRQLEQFSV